MKSMILKNAGKHLVRYRKTTAYLLECVPYVPTNVKKVA